MVCQKLQRQLNHIRQRCNYTVHCPVIEVKAPKITIAALVNFHIIYLLCKRWLSLKRYFTFLAPEEQTSLRANVIHVMRVPIVWMFHQWQMWKFISNEHFVKKIYRLEIHLSNEQIKNFAKLCLTNKKNIYFK